ncbi:hypothetical protein Tco_0073315 [Tanacetum coccineum]
MDDTTDQFDDDVDARLKEPTQTDKEVVQGEGADAEMIDAQQGNKNLETTQEQTKAAKYDLPGIEDMVPNIWSPVKVAYDRYALWGISHWREQRKSFYAYARGSQSRGDVYSTKCILAVTHVKVMRKHRYGYVEEIVVRRDDNALYRFKEGDFPRFQINDIEDMLILVVQNRLTNLSGDDVVNFDKFHKDVTKSLGVGFEGNCTMFSDGTLTDSVLRSEDITRYRHGVLR